MNFELFVSIFAALVAYRVVSPIVDAINPLGRLNRAKAICGTAGGTASGSSKLQAR